MALGTWHLALGTWDLGLGTWDLALGTWHLALGTFATTNIDKIRIFQKNPSIRGGCKKSIFSVLLRPHGSGCQIRINDVRNVKNPRGGRFRNAMGDFL